MERHKRRARRCDFSLAISLRTSRLHISRGGVSVIARNDWPAGSNHIVVLSWPAAAAVSEIVVHLRDTGQEEHREFQVQAVGSAVWQVWPC